MINVLHVNSYSDPDKMSNFIKDNINNISLVRIETQELLDEFEDIGLTKAFDNTNSLIVLRKISNRLFNNRIIKNKSPITSVDFMSDVNDYLACENYYESYLSLLALHRIPVFLTDADDADRVFGADFGHDTSLLSGAKDWDLYKRILNKCDVKHWVYRDSSMKPSLIELSNIGPDFPAYEIVNFDTGIPDLEYEESEYDAMMREING
jgi:hypothetical protein